MEIGVSVRVSMRDLLAVPMNIEPGAAYVTRQVLAKSCPARINAHLVAMAVEEKDET